MPFPSSDPPDVDQSPSEPADGQAARTGPPSTGARRPRLDEAAHVLAWTRTRTDWFGDRVDAVRPGGRGESFAVWRVRTGDAELALHVPLDASVRSRVPALVSALRAAPAGVGPRVVGFDGEGRYVTDWVEGEVVGPAVWTDAKLAGLARVLARLHRVRRDRPGPAADGGAQERGDLVAELDWSLDYWRTRAARALAEVAAPGAATAPPADSGLDTQRRAGKILHPTPRGRRAEPAQRDERRILPDQDPGELVQALRERLAGIEAAAPCPAGAALCHGDPVAGNVVWPPGSADPVLIDWEWARYGDPARDLGLIGGAVAADPWYAALAPDQVRRFVGAYRHEGGRGDLDALVARRDGWLLLTTFTDVVYLRSLELSGAATDANRASRNDLLRGLSAELLS